MFNTAWPFLQQGWYAVLDTLLPHSCPACHGYLPRQSRLGFCGTCYAKLPWWNPAQILPPKLPRHLDSFKAPFLYAAPLRDSLLDFKFNDATHLAPLLARLLYAYIPAGPEVVLIPVPMHPSRLRARTYNHAALLVQQLAVLGPWQADILSLTRIKKGVPQHNLSRAARLKLPINSFACGPAVAGKTVVLIDDIYTTGATMAACAGALKKAGAVAVHARALAYTAPE